MLRACFQSCWAAEDEPSSAMRSKNMQESGYLKAHWDIGLSSCCVKHGLGFTDKCLRCGSAVRWDRRSVEWGHCGHHLGRTGTSVADGKQLQVQRLLDGVFYRQQLSQVLAEFSLHPCIGLLSMDGLIHTLYAFGLLHGQIGRASCRERV